MSRIFTSCIALAVSAFSFAQTDILNEDFQLGFPSAWTIVDVDQQTPDPAVSEYSSAWIIKGDPLNPADSVVSSTSFFNPAGRADKWLITPPITLGNYGNILSWNARSHDPSYPDNYKVMISTSNQVADFQDTVRLIVLENPEWTAREINLSDLGFNGQTVYLAFVNNTDDGFKLYLDDIRVRKNDPAGVQEIEELNAQIYPNPAAENFKITGKAEIEQIYIYTSEGKLIREMNYQNGSSVNISDLDQGIYFVKMRSGAQYKTVRLAKK